MSDEKTTSTNTEEPPIHTFKQKMGMELDGVVIKSRTIPLIVLLIAVMVFITDWVQDYTGPYDIKIGTYSSFTELPKSGARVVYISDLNGNLRFGVFNRLGNKVNIRHTYKTFEHNITHPKEDILKAEIQSILANYDIEQWDSNTEDKSKLSDLVVQLIPEAGAKKSDDEDTTTAFGAAGEVAKYSKYWVEETPRFLTFVASGLKIFGEIFLIAFIPGIFGMIYRRAFTQWFVGTVILLFSINWWFDFVGYGSMSAALKEDLGGLYDYYYAILGFVILIIVKTRVKREVSAQTRIFSGQKWKAQLTGITFIAIGAIWLYIISSDWLCGIGFIGKCSPYFEASSQGSWGWFLATQLEGVMLFWLLAWRSLRNQVGFGKLGQETPKNIVFCLDGTWNHPGQTDFGYLAQTNVFKLFEALNGQKIRKHKNNSNHYKAYFDKPKPDNEEKKRWGNKDNRDIKQIGFYYHGVGNKVENSQIGQVIGGAFGMGADAIIDRAYLDLIRNYHDGGKNHRPDRIFIFGFSRGAAIARLLASTIKKRGIPTSVWTLRLFGRQWQVWKSSSRIENVPISVLGCWDTVGAFGLAKDIAGIPFQKINLLKDLSVPDSVQRAYHMVALDETRDAFVPTLMESDPIHTNRIIELWFSGNHANVGGGYATDQLSDIPLDFLLRHISSGYAYNEDAVAGKDESWGLYLTAERKHRKRKDGGHSSSNNSPVPQHLVTRPNPRGKIRFSTGPMYTHIPRVLPSNAIIADEVFYRMLEKDTDYSPESVINLITLRKERSKMVEQHIDVLEESKSISKDEADKMRLNAKANMKITKWSETEFHNNSNRNKQINPKQELSNN